MNPADPAVLLGEWRFTRSVDDRRGGATLAAEGLATFTRRGRDTIDWHERGVLHLPAGDVPVTTHRVLTRPGSGSWAVDFADGRGFHAWAVGVELVHACSPDLYRGRLDPAPSPGGWTMRWAASGPAKDYVIDTGYRRVA